ncbi:MAG: polyprenyl synthetase family protein [Gammaproteobacteria bacterium]
MNLTELSQLCQNRLEKLFNHYLIDTQSQAPELQKAMGYAVLNGGKRIRPLLVYATGLALDAPWENCDVPACALEFMHAYSLIHDDLPAMDNSDLRRGIPSCHKAFNEALAILAGDALQPLAFEVLASHPAPLRAEQRVLMIQNLSHASGMQGMAAGQTLDIEGTRALEEMYQLKTGALLTACVKLGAIAASLQNTTTLHALEKYARNIGLAFQIQDDLLDFENAEMTGKPQGLDVANQKMTYPAIHGIAHTRLKIEELFSEALSAVEVLGAKSEILREFAHYLMQRKI